MSEGPERSWRLAVVELATVTGWISAHFHDTRRQVVRPGGESAWIGDKAAAGFPDLVLVRERVVFAELKAQQGRLSANQSAWLRALERAGAEVYLWRPSDMDEVQATLTRREPPKPE